ncbi:MAG: trehalose-phosphatase [Planctomycetota bacterium]
MHELSARVTEIARAPVLLVASDFDGTLAPIVAQPALAEADRESLVALRALAQMPQTHVAIISGRPLADLAARAQESGFYLVGSHGSEFESGFVLPLAPEARERLEHLRAALRAMAAGDTGFLLEEKPAGFAFHYRNAPEPAGDEAVHRILAGPGSWPGVHVRQGKKVIELSVVGTNKGIALSKLRQRVGASAVLFFGDDVTDEDAFATLSGPDVGVKVGPGETAAAFRIENTLEVARVLAHAAETRGEWLAGSHAVPIERYALLSDQRTIALVGPGARIDWLCLPRLDSGAVFAYLLGGPSAGYFEIRPADAGARPRRQEYLGDTFVLRTEWPGLSVIDYLDCSRGRAYQRAGRSDLVRVVEGRGRVRITFAPRLDFGRIHTRLRGCADGIEVEGALDPLVLRAPGVRWQFEEEAGHQTAFAELDLSGPLVLELRYGTASAAPDRLPEVARRELNQRFWSSWADTLRLPHLARDLVRRSALVLKALSYGPSGAIAAAATTSLPEHAGGVRNWDYRFCWPRDAAMAAAALLRLGATGPALRFLDWMLGILDRAEPPAMLSPVYTVTGGHLGPEGEIGNLAGYRGSRPVRIGNAAAQQLQLDVFGPIAELLADLADTGAALSSEHWRLMTSMVAAVAARWRDPDHGIWEVRRPRQHHVHSKVLCWQTVDRALRLAAYLGQRRPEWEALAATIKADVLEHGWHAPANAFCATYEGGEPDASALAVGLSGLLPPSDPRFLTTIEYVERELGVDGTVYRYRLDDGLPGFEGGFQLCTTWLIEAYELAGRREHARRLFERYVAVAGPAGMYSEEYDPRQRLALGNYPQAYSHLGLINAAVRLSST